MKNHKHIAFTELSFQPFSGKFVTIVQYLKPISFLKFAFPSIWRVSSKYSTKQHTFTQLSSEQMSKI